MEVLKMERIKYGAKGFSPRLHFHDVQFERVFEPNVLEQSEISSFLPVLRLLP